MLRNSSHKDRKRTLRLLAHCDCARLGHGIIDDLCKPEPQDVWSKLLMSTMNSSWVFRCNKSYFLWTYAPTEKISYNSQFDMRFLMIR